MGRADHVAFGKSQTDFRPQRGSVISETTAAYIGLRRGVSGGKAGGVAGCSREWVGRRGWFPPQTARERGPSGTVKVVLLRRLHLDRASRGGDLPR